MGIIVKEIPYPQGESVSLVKHEGDEFFILDMSERHPEFENAVTFIMKDKKAMNTLANRLKQIIICIEQHEKNCDCP